MTAEMVALAIAISVLAGTLSGLLGLVGGIMLGLEEHVAQGVALAVATASALVTAWTNLRFGTVERRSALWMAVGAVVDAFLGASLADTLDGPLLRRLFACALVVIGVRMLPRDVRARLARAIACWSSRARGVPVSIVDRVDRLPKRSAVDRSRRRR